MNEKFILDERIKAKYLFFPTYMNHAVSELYKKWHGTTFKRHICMHKNDICYLYFYNHDLERVGKIIVTNIMNDKDYITTLMKDYKEQMKKLKELMTITNEDVKNMDDNQLFEHIKKVKDYYAYLVSVGLLVEPFHRYLDKTIEEEEENAGIKSGEVAQLLKPTVKSFVATSRDKLIEIARLIKKKSILNLDKKERLDYNKLNGFINSNPEIKFLIDEFISKYYWLNSSYSKAPRLSYEDVIKSLKEIFDEDGVFHESGHGFETIINVTDENMKELVKKEKEKIMNKYNFSKEFIAIVNVIDEITKIHDLRKEYFLRIAYYYLNLICPELENRFSLPTDFIEWVNLEDELSLFKTKEGMEKLKELVEKRNKLVICDSTIDGYKEYYGKEADDFYDTHLKEADEIYDNEHTSEIKGRIVEIMQGVKIQGNVKIVLSPKDVIDDKEHENNQKITFNEGDILVTTMTRPDFVPLMKKAGAIVTDEGGLMCHAAIISRELGIPCIVGTKNATKILENNEIVIVDAEHGIVNRRDKT